MEPNTKAALLTFLWLLTGAKVALGDGYIQIQFETYSNQDGRCQDGTFCDPFGVTFVGDKCDPQFRLIADKASPGGTTVFDYQQTGVYWDFEHINFGSTFGEIPNPVPIAMHYWNPGYLHITVSVVDKDPIPPDDPLDTFSATLLTRADSVRRSLMMTSPPRMHTLTINYWFTCNVHFYGLDCNTYCLSQDDSAKGHFTCGPDGTKVCMTGWTGAGCTEAAPCAGDPCLNGGECVDDDSGGFHCRCLPEFNGTRCQEDLCSDVFCANNGTCRASSEEPGRVGCFCPPGFSGKRCQSSQVEVEAKSVAALMAESKSEQEGRRGIIAGSVVGAVVLLAALVFVSIFVAIKRARNSRNKKDQNVSTGVENPTYADLAMTNDNEAKY